MVALTVVVEDVAGDMAKIVEMNLEMVEVTVGDTGKTEAEDGMEQSKILGRGRRVVLLEQILKVKKCLQLKNKPWHKSRSTPNGKGRRTKKRSRASGVPRRLLQKGQVIRRKVIKIAQLLTVTMLL
jgi:hypothetical protein